jgi:hypothetical protein
MATEAIVKGEADKFALTLSTLQAEAQSIAVKTPESCLTAKTMQQQVRRWLKSVHEKLDPFVNIAKNNYDDAKAERAKWVDPGEAIDDQLAQKVKEFERLERERTAREQEEYNRQKREREAREADAQRKVAEAQAKADREKREKEIAEARKAGELKAAEAKKLQKQAEEQERIAKEQAAKNAEAEKANFQEVTIKPNIPTVAGVPSRLTWKFRILDATRIPRAYMQPNEMKIGAEVRFTKDKGKSEAAIPGIEVYQE